MSKVGRISRFGKNTIQRISTQTSRYGQRYLPPIVIKGSQAVIQDAKWTTKYYKIKATRGWVTGRKISNKRRLSKPMAFITQTGYAIKETARNLQRKDVLPILGSGVGLCTPLLGGWFLGFVAGKGLNQLGTTLGKAIRQILRNLRHLK